MLHIPVLRETALTILAPRTGDTVLDVTLGLGGHASSFLHAIGPSGFLVGLDADVTNLAFAQKSLDTFQNTLFIHTNFSTLPDSLPPEHRAFDVIFADLGLSSPHVDDPERGFTFRGDSPLDMRFDQSGGESAARFLQASDPLTLRKVFLEYGELPRVPALVRAVVKRRSSANRIQTSADLRGVVEEVYGYLSPKVLPQVFQAIRMYVNDELHALENLLSAAISLLAPGGRLGVISYHSLEDRIVKNTFRDLVTPVKHPITGAPESTSSLEIRTKKPLKPTPEEIQKNPRARSAIFRAIRLRSM